VSGKMLHGSFIQRNNSCLNTGMTDFNLRKELSALKDKRRGQAQQHKIDVLLMITIRD